MAFGADEEVWDDLLDDVRENLATVAQAIARFEPVMMLVRPGDMKLAGKLCGDRVTLVEAALNDLWIRDTGPTFVFNETGDLGAADLNFNGWGEKQDYDDDATVAELVAKQYQGSASEDELVGEGGGIEVDGEGTSIITESCFLNDNRNPDLEKSEVEIGTQAFVGATQSYLVARR